jgi:hypothetical protein
MTDADSTLISEKVNKIFGVCMAITTIMEHSDGLPVAKKQQIKDRIIAVTSAMPLNENGDPRQEALRIVDLILKG